MIYYLIIFSIISTTIAQLADVDRMQHDLSKFLSVPRYTVEEKKKAREEISRAFEGMGLASMVHSFVPEDTDAKISIGHNVISIQAGPHYGSPEDKIIVVCANYDTMEDLPGVVDNGSGVSSVLETARTMATLDRLYNRQYTIVYALVDMKQTGLSGSHSLVIDILLPMIKNSNSTIEGVFVLDGVMNFDPFPTTQGTPIGFEELFPGPSRELSEHNHMGDYVQITGRMGIDDIIMQSFMSAFSRSSAMVAPNWSFRPWILPLKLPMHEIVTMEGLHQLHPYLYSDHSSFYFNEQKHLKIPTVHISDTLNYRGVKQYCPYCDGLYMINEQNLRFLTLITDSVIRSVIQLSKSQAMEIVDELHSRFGFNEGF